MYCNEWDSCAPDYANRNVSCTCVDYKMQHYRFQGQCIPSATNDSLTDDYYSEIQNDQDDDATFGDDYFYDQWEYYNYVCTGGIFSSDDDGDD